MKAEELYQDIRKYCRKHADKAVAKKYSRFFKDGYDAYGLAHEHYDDKIKSILSDKSINMKLILSASRYLLISGKYEETFFAVLLLKEFSEQFQANTFTEISKWFEIGVVNWAHTDVICRDIITPFLERKIITYKALAKWRTAKNKYQRRAVPVAMLALLESTKNYTPLFKFIEPLMTDPEEKVQQGLGWFLREAWKISKKETESFLLKWKDQAPRTIFQYATEKMTAVQKKRFKKNKK